MSTARQLALRDGIVLHTVRDERKDLLAARSTALASMNKTLDRAERREDGCLTACEESVVVSTGKYIRKLDADLAQLKAQPTTKGHRGRRVSELRAELEADTRKHDPERRPAAPLKSWQRAYHEAGHAVAFEARGVRVLSVTLSECRPEKPEAVGALCGAIAAQRIGYDDAHSPSDMAMAKAALLSEGKSEHRLPEVESEARSVVARSSWLIQGVAAALYESGKLTGDQVRGLMNRSAFEVQERARYCRQHGIAQRPPRRYAA